MWSSGSYFVPKGLIKRVRCCYRCSIQRYRVACRYATVRDLLNPVSDIDVCGGWRRQNHVVTSFSHELQVNFIGRLVDERLPNFLLQYQGVLGTDSIIIFLPIFLPLTRRQGFIQQLS